MIKSIVRASVGCLLLMLATQFGHAVEPTWEYSVQVSATTQTAPPQIALSWPQDTTTTPVRYTVYRKAPGATSWGSGTVLSGTTLTYTDSTVSTGVAYEYEVVKTTSSYTGYGYITAGIQVPLVESRGKVILVVDNTMSAPLATELTRLQQDLAGDGWTVIRHDVARTDSVVNVKNLIKTDYNADPANVKSVFLFGHVPVPYSGLLNPDGHADHYGAWPADVYYGDMDGSWTDSSVNYSQTVNTDPADRARLSNVPGDGKFDQTAIPSAVELQVGRVDLANMPGRLVWGGPASFPTETELLRQYLTKDHNFRHKLLTAPRKAVVGDYFGVRSGEAFAASGYRNFAPLVGPDNIDNLNVMFNDTQGVWIPRLAANQYLLAYGCGAGSYTTIGGLGNTGLYHDGSTTEMVNNNVHGVFTLLFGSWLGDWDHEDNILRSILATSSHGLAAAWSGRPHWFIHPMGMGETIGYTARLTQNNSSSGLYQNQVNSSAGNIHVGLMGDPTLRLHPVAPPGTLNGSTGTGVNLTWSPSSETVQGYHVYRATSAAGPFTRLTSSLLTTTSFVDTTAPAGANTYMVRAVKLESSPSGTYYNASQGSFWTTGSAPPPQGDTTAPTVSISAPTSGASVTGSSVTVSATAADNVGVVGVQFKLDGANVGTEKTTSPYSIVWDSTTVANGSHSLSAVARDLAGNQTTATAITVTVNNTTSGGTGGTGGTGGSTNTTAGTVVWTDDAVPTGAAAMTGTTDTWNWVTTNPTPYSGTKAHQSALATGYHDHYFNWATPLTPGTGDSLFAYVYLDAANPPTEVMLAWNTASGDWEHRAYWGANSLAFGTDGSTSRYHVGALPAAGQWARLEVPASAVGLEGVSLQGMSFVLFNGRATWDYAGKAASSSSTTTNTPPVSTNTPPGTLPTVSVTSTKSTATISSSDNAVVTFTRAGDTSSALTVNYALGGTAVKWVDYRRVEGDMPVSVTIPAGSAATTMTLYAVGNATAANPETATFTLAPDAAYAVGTANNAMINILAASGGGTVTNTPPVDTNTIPVITNTLPNLTNSVPLISAVDYTLLNLPPVGDHTLHVISPTQLELRMINSKAVDPGTVSAWNFVDSAGNFTAPAASKFAVTVNGQTVSVQSIGFKRRPFYAPLAVRDLRLDNALVLQLGATIPDDAAVEVKNPDGTLWAATTQYLATKNPLRYSPAIHVNQEGYVPSFPKEAMVGYYLGNLGEMAVPSTVFQLIDVATGNSVYQGTLSNRLDVGYTFSPAPYQKVYVANFSSFTTPGEYRLAVPGLGASLPFLIDDGVAMAFTRAYALGLYHQRCGTNNALPYSRFVHDVCHAGTIEVPSPQTSYPFTWTTVAAYANTVNSDNPAQTAPKLTSESAALYPYVNKTAFDAHGGHHDAGDYSKYTLNSAQLVHLLMFSVDSFQGVAALDNLGIPESGDGISDVMQEAKWEADYLARIQDTDGGFYFLVYPKNREYENNVTPDHGDPQVAWPKTTSSTAAAVAALAQCASSPKFKAQYPTEAALYLQKARLGWQFLTNAVARYGKAGSYQKITHYGDVFTHDDELAWAACEMFLATGDQTIHQQLKTWFPNPNDVATYRWGWWRMWESYGNAVRSYAFAVRSGRLTSGQIDSAYLAKCETEVKGCGNDVMQRAFESAYGTSFPSQTKAVRGGGWYFSSDQAFDITAAYQLDPRPEYKVALLENMNYEGGCNAANASYITGLGWKRQREIVHQYAQNDRRTLPPTGIPQGNIQAYFSYVDKYGSELNATCFPGNDTTTAPFGFYDRWGDIFNVTTEFVAVTQARSLASLAFWAAQTPLKTQAWRSVPAQIGGLPAQVLPNTPVTATLQVSGVDLTGARIVWEAQGQEPAYGDTYTFVPSGYGEQWIEAEAQMPDGRRVFASTSLFADNALPTVSITSSDATATEGGTDTASFTLTRTGSTTNAITVSLAPSGTAAKWTDYRRPQGDMPDTFTIPAGSNSVTVTIVAWDDTEVEGNESVVLTIQPGTDYNIGSPNYVTLTLQDNDGSTTLPAVSVAATDTTASETAGDTGTFTVSRTGATTAALTVSYTVGGTATSGSDYTALSGSVTIPAGAASATITVTPVDDTTVESAETVILTLAANAAYTVSSPGSATITITDNDTVTTLPSVTVTATDATASETAGDTGTFTVSRTGATTAALTVSYTVGGTATSGSDYTALSGSVTIPAGAASATITVTPVDDTTVESAETVVLTLANNSAYTVGSPANATITIADNDTVSTLPTVTVTATDTNASRLNLDPGSFMVTRTGSTAAALIVSISLNGTATNGVDYSTVNTNVTIPIGATTATITFVPKVSLNLVGTKTVVASVVAKSAYTVGISSSASAYLFGNNVPVTSINVNQKNIVINWNSVAGKIYRVAYKNNLADTTWTSLSGNVTATGTSTTWSDTSVGNAKQRYYTVYVIN